MIERTPEDIARFNADMRLIAGKTSKADRLYKAERTATESQEALRNIVTILEAINGGAKRDTIFYELGRAIGTAKLAIRLTEAERKELDAKIAAIATR